MSSSEATQQQMVAAGGETGGWWATLRRGYSHAVSSVAPWGQSTVLVGLRLVYGWMFAQAGWGKLANLEGTAGFFESIGLPVPGFTAALVGLTELVGGTLLALGAGARFAAAALVVVMVTALGTAHASEAFASLEAFTQQAPYPFLVASLVVLFFGAGRFSVDGLTRRLTGDPSDRADRTVSY